MSGTTADSESVAMTITRDGKVRVAGLVVGAGVLIAGLATGLTETFPEYAEHSEEIATVVVACGLTVGRIVQQTVIRGNRFDPRSVPWTEVKRAFMTLRRQFFTVPRPAGDGQLIVHTDDLHALEAAFGKAHYTNDHELSYRYEGEIGNLRQPVYLTPEEEQELAELYDGFDAAGEPYYWYQNHIRLFEHDDGYEVYAHFELDPTEHPDAHVDGVNHVREESLWRVVEILETNDLEYTLRSRSDSV